MKMDRFSGPEEHSMQATLRCCLALILVVAAVGGLAPSASAAARTCRHDLFLRSGIAEVTVERVSCRRAIGALRSWVRRGMSRSGPRGWRCRMRRIGDEAPYTRVRCARRSARMRFNIAP
jgi:hypothetical protein